MENILVYAKQFQHSFEEKPFSDVDSLVLSLLAYLCYEDLGVSATSEPQTLQQLARRRDTKPTAFGAEGDETVELLWAAGSNPRFMHIRLEDYVSILDEAAEMQFAAVSFALEGGLTFVAFRGTDATLVGWKENVNMTVLHSTPGQREGVVYLDRVARQRQGSLMVGGHSKGGNIAVYASACCAPSTQARILTVFNHDGPGFQRPFVALEGYKTIAERVRKILPEQSMVGLLLNHKEPYIVIQSSAEGINQHSGFSWLIQDGAFVQQDGLSRSAWLMANSINLRINTINEEQLRAMIDALFEVIRVTEVSSFEALAEALTNRSPEVEGIIGGLSASARGKFLTIVRIFGVVFQGS